MQSTKITFRIDSETDAKLEKIAIKEYISKSDVVREFINRGLKEDGYAADDNRLHHMVKNALKEIIDPAVNRLAAISAKNAQMAGGNFVFLTTLGKLLAGQEGAQQIDQLAEQSRLSGIELLRAKEDTTADVFKKARKNAEEFL